MFDHRFRGERGALSLCFWRRSMSWLRHLALLALAVALCAGCQSPDPPPDPDEFADAAQKRVSEFVVRARANPQDAPQDLALLMESLDSYAEQHQGGYVQLRDTAQKLQTLYANNGGRTDIDATLSELETEAKGLKNASE
jgi:hypothetical protein